jgi:hypothetical protein
LGWALDQNGDVYTDIAQESPVNVTPALSTDDWFEYEQSASKVITSMEMNTAAFVCGHFDTADYVFISSNIGSFYCGQLTVSPSGYLCMLLTCCSTIDTGLSAIRDPACAAFQVNQDVEAVSAYYSPPVESSQLPEQFGILGEKSFTASPPGAGNDTPASYGDSEPYTVRFLDAPGPRLSAPNIVALRENTVIAWRMAAHHWVTWNGAVIPDSETGWMSYTYDITIRKTSPAGVSPITYTPLINTITPGTDQIDWMDIVEGRQLAGVE